MTDGGPWEDATINKTLHIKTPIVDDDHDEVLVSASLMRYPHPSGILTISRGAQIVKDVSALGNLSSESPTKLKFSDSNYTNCYPSDIGLGVKKNGISLPFTVLYFYSNEDKEWWLSRPFNDISNGSTLTINGGYGAGTVIDTLMNTGGGAVMIGKGYEDFNDPPRICLTNGDTLYVTAGSTEGVGADAVTANLKVKDLTTTGNLTIQGSLTGNVTANTNLILSASNGSVQLQTGGWIQWGTNDTKIGRNIATRAFSGTPAVEIWGWNPQSSSYEAGVLITSGLQVDHIDSATGSGITVFDNVNLSGSLYAQHVYAKGSSSSGNGAHLWADTPGHFFLATHNATSPAWRIGYGNGSGGLDTDQPNVLSDGQVLTFSHFTSIRTAAIYGETGASNVVLHGTADYATSAGSASNATYASSAGSSSSASAIPTYSGSDPSSPPSGSIWLRTDL